MIKELTIETTKRNELIDITELIIEQLKDKKNELVTLHIPHTTAAITINEGADPDVKDDILRKLEKLVPKDDDHKHSEGNSDAHIKATIVGSTINLIAEDGKIFLGTWQSIFFCEFDGPRKRKIIVKIGA